MNVFDSIFSGNIAQALGWALVHSIWQIAIVSLLLAAVMVVLHDKSARLRYLIAIGSLGLILLVSAITFFSVLQSPRATATGNVEISQITYTQLFFDTNYQQGFFTAWMSNISSFIEQNLNLFLAAWFVGVGILSVRLTGGIAYIMRLRSKRLKPVAANLNAKLLKLTERFQLKKKVQLFESALVSVPTVVGYLKPYILVPVGTFAGLPVNQIEAILAHELAHIKRNDYLINIFQSVLEIVYFFHPGIWWISNTIRKERELCCDDLALESGCDAITLARALTTIEELSINQSKTTLAMALTGKGTLLNRIKRLIGHSEKSSSTVNGISGTLIILITALIAFTMNSSDVFSSATKQQNLFSNAVYNDKTPIGKSSLTSIITPVSFKDSIRINKNLTIDDRDALVIIKDDKGDVKDIRINGKSVPKENWNEENLQALINQRLGAPVAPVAPVPPVPAVGHPDAPVPPAPCAPFNSQLPPVPPVPAFPPFPPMNFDMKGFNFDLNMEDFKADMTPAERKKFEKKMEKFNKEMEARSKEWEKKYGKEWEMKIQQEWEPQMKDFEVKMNAWAKEAEPHLQMLASNTLDNFNFNATDLNGFMFNSTSNANLEQQLINDGLIKSGESYQFSISGKNKELTVNGKKQSAELFEKYDKLIKNSNRIKSDDYSISISK